MGCSESAGRARRGVGFASQLLCAAWTVACTDGRLPKQARDDAGAPDASAARDDAGNDAECRTHADCVRQHGEHWICRKPDRTCVSLLSPDCTLLRGEDANDDAVFVGVLQTEGAPLFGVSNLVRGDFSDAVGGLPAKGTEQARPFVLVGCSFMFGQDPLPAARHLVETLGVPAIVGPQGSQTAINVAQNLTIPAGVLMMSPTAQSDLVSALKDDDLVFRTSPTTKSVAPQVAAIVADVEAVVRRERALASIKIALVSARDAYGLALSAATAALLRFNEGLTADDNERIGKFLAVSYDAAEPMFEQAVAERVAAFGPSIVVSLTPAEQRAFQAIEESLGDDPERAPFYVMAGGFQPDSTKFVASRPDSLRARIRFASNVDETRPLYQQYLARIEDEFGTSPLLVAGAGTYDATFAVALGIIASDTSPPTGASIARGIRRLTGPGTSIDVAPEHIARAARLLRGGERIDLDGVSGPLDFDEHGDVTSDGSVECLATDETTGELSLVFSGQTYRTAEGKLEGTFTGCK